MKLLILTQKVDVNGSILGFFHGWIEEFAKNCEQVTVICLQEGLPCEMRSNFSERKIISQGDYNLPENVKILSLGKENGISKIKYIFNFYKYIWRERKNYNRVFVHMNPEYVVLGGLFWRLWNKKIGLWYTHKAVNLKLRIAEKLVNKIFTASKESFRLKSKKVIITGHGIDIKKFKIQSSKFKVQNINKKFKIITIGRISRIKNLDILIKAANILRDKNSDFKINIIGAPISEKDKIYFEKLKELIKEKKLENYINFLGSIPHKNINKFYQKADLSINLCPTGGMDKAVLESIACVTPVIVLNKTFANTFGEFQNQLILKNPDVNELAEKINQIIELPTPQKDKMKNALYQTIVINHNLENLIKKIVFSL
ncbi:MAG: glycosyltransferase [Patescibacteria group bacterium]